MLGATNCNSGSYLSVMPHVPNNSSAYRPHCRCRTMSISSCSLSMNICCMQPWKRFNFVSHLNTVLLVFGQPECRKANIWIEQRRFVSWFQDLSTAVLSHQLTSEKVAVSCPNCERVSDLQRRPLLLINCESEQVVSGCQIHRMPVTVI